MSNTIASTNARIDSLESKLDAILAAATSKPEAPAKSTAGKGKAKASKAKAVTEVALRTLTKATRLEFLAEHEWTTGLPVEQRSTSALSALVLAGTHELNDGWKVSTFREAKAAGVTVKEFVAQRDGAKPAKVAKKKAAAKVAEPEVTPAAKGPRNQHGHITARREWPLREALAQAGHDRKTIDKRVAKAIRKGLI